VHVLPQFELAILFKGKVERIELDVAGNNPCLAVELRAWASQPFGEVTQLA